MRQIIVTVDVVGSTAAKEIYGDEHAIKMISAALQLVEDDLRAADSKLHLSGPSAGDSILLVGGVDHVAIYRAAVMHQSKFIGWCYNRIPVKIAIGYGEFEDVTDTSGFTHSRGSDLDFLYRICDFCPPAGVVVTPPMYGMLKEASFGTRFIQARENLKGLGEKIFYESDGDYRIPEGERQRRPRCSDKLPPPRSPSVTEALKSPEHSHQRIFIGTKLNIFALRVLGLVVLAYVVIELYFRFKGLK